MRLTLVPRRSALRCAFCHDALDAPRGCPVCGTALHVECWELARGCTTLRCPRFVRARRIAGATVDHLLLWLGVLGAWWVGLGVLRLIAVGLPEWRTPPALRVIGAAARAIWRSDAHALVLPLAAASIALFVCARRREATRRAFEVAIVGGLLAGGACATVVIAALTKALA